MNFPSRLDPLFANERNYYKVEQWTQDGLGHSMQFLDRRFYRIFGMGRTTALSEPNGGAGAGARRACDWRPFPPGDQAAGCSEYSAPAKGA